MDSDLSWLHNQSLQSVELVGQSWHFRCSDDVSLRIDCTWRIVSEGKIALGRLDHGQWFGHSEPVNGEQMAIKLLSDQRITGTQVHQETSDLTLEFSQGTRLELINDSSGYEGWLLSSPSGKEWIAMGGGKLVVLSPDEH